MAWFEKQHTVHQRRNKRSYRELPGRRLQEVSGPNNRVFFLTIPLDYVPEVMAVLMITDVPSVRAHCNLEVKISFWEQINLADCNCWICLLCCFCCCCHCLSTPIWWALWLVDTLSILRVATAVIADEMEESCYFLVRWVNFRVAALLHLPGPSCMSMCGEEASLLVVDRTRPSTETQPCNRPWSCQ